VSPTAPRAAAAFAVAALVAALLPSAAAPAAEPEQDQEFVQTGTFSRLPDDARRAFGEAVVPRTFEPNSVDGAMQGTMFPVYEARQLWQVYTFHDGVGQKSALAIRDLDSLRLLATSTIDGAVERRGTNAFGGTWMTAVDPGGRVFLVTSEPAVVAVDFRTFTPRGRYPLDAAPLMARGGIAYDRYGDRLVLTWGGPANFSAVNTVTQLEVVDLASGTVQPKRPLRTCNAPQPGVEGNMTYQVALYITERYMYVPCHRSGNVGAVTRVERSAMLDPTSTEASVAGPTNVETALVDPATGRIFMPTIRGVVWVFDTDAMAFVGVIGANVDRGDEGIGYGLDPVSGRLYFLSRDLGLGVAEGRHFPIPQAKVRRDLAARGQELLIGDERNRRVFVMRGAQAERDHHYTIYRMQPAPAPPPPPDPDRNTVDQPEGRGSTESRYNAATTGYGVRVLLAGGLSTVPPAPTLGELAPTPDLLVNNLNVKCGFTDRELVAARVSKAEADTGSAAAEAAAVTMDPRTRLDLDRPSRCEPYGKNGQDYLAAVFATAPEPYDNASETSRWNRDPAVCSTSEGDKPQESDGDDHGAPPVGTNRVECPTPGAGDLRASARASLTGPVTVQRAHVETVVTRGPGRIRVTSEAKAENIELGGAIMINEVRSTAVSEATGRPRDGDMSVHTVLVRGLSVGGKKVCDICDVDDVETLNRALFGRAEFRIGHRAADSRLLKGSPRGALTAVQKSAKQQFSDRALIGDSTADVPGLELIVYNDNSKWGRGRQIYQFAGVSTSATYNIVPVPRFDGVGDETGNDGGGDGGGGGAPASEDAVAIDGATASVDMPLNLDAAGSGRDGGGGVLGAIGRAVRAVARGLVLFATDPRHGLAILTGWALLGLPAVLFRRRLSVAAGVDAAPRSAS
jgi:hypothetical protein